MLTDKIIITSKGGRSAIYVIYEGSYRFYLCAAINTNKLADNKR